VALDDDKRAARWKVAPVSWTATSNAADKSGQTGQQRRYAPPAIPEESTVAIFGDIKELVRNDDMAGGVILAERAAGIDADNAFRSQRFEA